MLATCNTYRANRHGSESPYPGSTPGLNPTTRATTSAPRLAGVPGWRVDRGVQFHPATFHEKVSSERHTRTRTTTATTTRNTATQRSLALRNGLTVELRKGPLNRHTLGCPRVSKGCHRKFRGLHNFESCVTNFDKISVFSLRSRKGPRWQISWISTLFGIRSVSDLQNENPPTPLTRLAARSAAAGCGLGPKMARQFEVRHCLSPPTSEIHKICTCSDRGPYALLPSLSGTCVLRVSRGGKWSGEWQISIERLERAQVLGGADSRHCRWAPSLITVVYQT